LPQNRGMGAQVLLIGGLRISFGTVVIGGGIHNLFYRIAPSQIIMQLAALFSAGIVFELALWLRWRHLRALREQRLEQRMTSALRRSLLFDSEGLEFPEHGGDEFGDRGMNVNSSLDDCIRRPGIHDVQNGVDGLIATDA